MQNSLNNQMDTLFKPSNVQTLDETVDDFKEIGTGLLTGTIAIPSDVVTGAETVNTFLAENSYSPLAMLIKDNLQEFEKEYGRKAFDQGFEEITGIKSDPTNMNQLVGEILSPTGAFLAPTKLVDKLSDGASALYNKIKNTLSANNFGKSDLVTEGAYIDPIMTIPKKDIDVNRPKIDLNVIGENNPLGKEQAQKYRIAEYGELQTGTAKRGQKPVKSSVFTFNITEEDSIKNYEMLTLPQKQTLYKATGVYRGADGKLRYAIPMKDATLNTDAFKVGNDGNLIIPEGATLKDILNFQDLFKQYDKKINVDIDGVSKSYKPIGDIKIVRVPKNEMDEVQATYNPNTDEIGLSPNTPKGMLSDIIHELQHAIQRREGFDSGSSVSRETLKLDPDYNVKADNLKKSLGGIQSEFFEKVNNRNKNIIDVLKFNLTQNELLKSSEPQFVDELMKTFGSKGMNEMFQEKFENMITKLAQREQINYNKFNGDINFNVSSDETYYTTLSNNPLQIAMSNKINFDKAEANTIRLLSGMPEFKPYMKKRIEILNEADKLNETYKQAEKNYRSSRGEVEAFFAQKRLEDPDETPGLGQFYKGEKQIPKKLDLDVEQSVNLPKFYMGEKGITNNLDSFVKIDDFKNADNALLERFKDNIYSIADKFDDNLKKSNLPIERKNKVEIQFDNKFKAFDKEIARRKKSYLSMYDEVEKYKDTLKGEDADTFTEAFDSAYNNAAETILENPDNIFGEGATLEELQKNMVKGNLIHDQFFFANLYDGLINANAENSASFVADLFKKYQ